MMAFGVTSQLCIGEETFTANFTLEIGICPNLELLHHFIYIGFKLFDGIIEGVVREGREDKAPLRGGQVYDWLLRIKEEEGGGSSTGGHCGGDGWRGVVECTMFSTDSITSVVASIADCESSFTLV